MKIETSELTGAALDWIVAKCEGRVLTEPKPASYEKVHGLRIPFQLWDVVCTYRNDVLVSATPMPIRVDRCGVDHSVGASAPSITFSSGRDRNARGSVDMFYMTEGDAETVAALMLNGGLDGFEPSTDWAQGGPIIEREMIDLRKIYNNGLPNANPYDCWKAEIIFRDGKLVAGDLFAYGPTPLIAAMRCFVASKLGDEIDVPEELLP